MRIVLAALALAGCAAPDDPPTNEAALGERADEIAASADRQVDGAIAEQGPPERYGPTFADSPGNATDDARAGD